MVVVNAKATQALTLSKPHVLFEGRCDTEPQASYVVLHFVCG